MHTRTLSLFTIGVFIGLIGIPLVVSQYWGMPDALKFWSPVFDGIGKLAWPVAAVFLGVIFREDLCGILGSLAHVIKNGRFKAGIFETSSGEVDAEVVDNDGIIKSKSVLKKDIRELIAKLGKKPGDYWLFARSAMELKILQTLWIKQINKWPDFSKYWTFTINGGPEHNEFVQTRDHLADQGLIAKKEDGQVLLTKAGAIYCYRNYEHFPIDHWWPGDQLIETNLQKAGKIIEQWEREYSQQQQDGN